MFHNLQSLQLDYTKYEKGVIIRACAKSFDDITLHFRLAFTHIQNNTPTTQLKSIDTRGYLLGQFRSSHFAQGYNSSQSNAPENRTCNQVQFPKLSCLVLQSDFKYTSIFNRHQISLDRTTAVPVLSIKWVIQVLNLEVFANISAKTSSLLILRITTSSWRIVFFESHDSAETVPHSVF